MKPRQKTKRHQNRNQNGTATNSTAISKHKDLQKKDKSCDVRNFYINWPKKIT